MRIGAATVVAADRRGTPRRLRGRRLPEGHGPDRDPDAPDAGRAAARVPVDRAVHQRGQDAALPDDRARRPRSATTATSNTSCRTRARTAVAESTRCLQCTCEAIGFCDLRRLGIEYGTTLQTLEPAVPPGCRLPERDREPVHRRQPRLHPRRLARLHPARAVALHRLRPVRQRLRRGRRRRLLRLHADRLRHAGHDAARHEPQRHAVRVVRPLRRDVPDRAR